MTDSSTNENQSAQTNPENIVVGQEPENAESEAPILERREGSENNQLKRAIFDVPIDVVVSVGKARPLIGDLLNMGRDHLLPLDTKLEDPVELMVKDRVIAKGNLIESTDAEGQLAVKLTEVINISALSE